MTLRTPVALKCLAGPRRPFDRPRAESLGIDPSSEDFPNRVMGAIFGGLDGEPPLSDEELGVEVAMLCEALENAFPRQAECFLQLAQAQPEADEGGRHGRHTAKIERLVRSGKAGWVNDVAGVLAPNGAKNKAILVLAGEGIPVLDAPGGNLFIETKKTLPRVPFPMNDFIDHLERDDVEDCVSHMYLDNDENGPNVTIGIGTNLTDNGGPDGAVALLQGSATVRATGNFATEQEIRDDYAEVAGQPAGNGAGWYRQFTTLDIGNATARQLAEDFALREIATVVRGGLYPDFEKTPAKAQMGLMDIDYNLGYTRFSVQFEEFPKAYNRRDWRTAGIETFRSQISAERNGIVLKFFLDTVEDQKFFILKAINPGEGIAIDDIE